MFLICSPYKQRMKPQTGLAALLQKPTKIPDMCFGCRHHTVLQTQSCWRRLLRCFAASSPGLSLTAVCVETSSPHYSWRSRPQVNMNGLILFLKATLCMCFYFSTSLHWVSETLAYCCLSTPVIIFPLVTSQRNAFRMTLWQKDIAYITITGIKNCNDRNMIRLLVELGTSSL